MKIINHLQGYVRVRITGYSPERFINLCKYKEIEIWDLEASPKGYEMSMSIQGFRKLKPILRKTRTRIAVIRRYGVPFFMYRNRKHKWFWIGGVICVALVMFISRFVWDIKLDGNQKITDDVLTEYLHSISVHKGMLLSGVQCDEIAKDIRKKFPDIIWVSASVDGCNLTIDIRENTDIFQVSQADSVSGDMVAMQDGVISRIVTRTGVPCVKVGDTVKAGDVLVSGTVEVLNDAGEVIRTEEKRADADVWAEVILPYEDFCEERYQKKEYCNREYAKVYVGFGAYQFVFGLPRSNKFQYETYTSRNHVKINGIIDTSVEYGSVYERAYRWREAKRSPNERIAILEQNLQQYCSELEKNNIVILDHAVEKEEVADGTYFRGYFKVQQSIGTIRKSVDF